MSQFKIIEHSQGRKTKFSSALCALRSFVLVALLFTFGCQSAKIPFHPHVAYTPPCHCLKHKPSIFAPLSKDELKHDSAKELLVGLAFAKECDFYRAITAFKRALILLPDCMQYRKLEIEYDIILAYFLAEKYEDVLKSFNASCLPTQVTPQFPAFRDLLIILYESSLKTCNPCDAERIRLWLNQFDPKTATKLTIATKIQEGDLRGASMQPDAPPYLFPLYKKYLTETKSINTARALNAVLPGAGYLYVGQKNTALTAFIINGLFIAAAYQFFHKGYIAAGIITTSLETGWYFGGIYGGGRAAAEYNEHKYDKYGRKAMNESCLYPTLMLNFVF